MRSRSQWCLEKPAGDLSLLERCREARAQPVWVPSREAPQRGCMLCNASFSLLRRHKHCYNCGWIVCEACSPDTLLLGRWLDEKKPHTLVSGAVPNRSFTGGPKNVRVCTSCYEHAPTEERIRTVVDAMHRQLQSAVVQASGCTSLQYIAIDALSTEAIARLGGISAVLAAM